MNRQMLLRKAGYLVAIVALLLPLSLLSQPATSEHGDTGGELARLRDAYQLRQANLGRIDPGSEAVKLASLGLRGVASTVLAMKADEYRTKENWIAYTAALHQLVQLQPNYVNVWIFQGSNLATNIAGEFDNYLDRYYWAIKGVEFLQAGTQANRRSSKLLVEIGQTVANRIGRADERQYFRPEFRADERFHERQRDARAGLPVVYEPEMRDNWWFSRAYYRAAQAMVDAGQAAVVNEAVNFHTLPVSAQTYGALALEDDWQQALDAAARSTSADGTANAARERARRFAAAEARQPRIAEAWRKCELQWLRDPGAREFVDPEGRPYRIVDLDSGPKLGQRWLDAVRQLEALAPGARQQIEAEKRAALPAAMRTALETPADRRTEQQAALAVQAEARVLVTYAEVAARAPHERRAEATRLAQRAADDELAVFDIDAARGRVDYDSWLARCRFEQTPLVREARRLVHQAMTLYKIDADLVAARRDFEAAFQLWRQAIDRHEAHLPLTDMVHVEMAERARDYRRLLRQLDQDLPADFPLAELYHLNITDE